MSLYIFLCVGHLYMHVQPLMWTKVCPGVCGYLSPCSIVHMVVDLSHVPLVLTIESGKSCSEELSVPSS